MTIRYTLGQLARKTGLARSSLLHYEAAGLLRPADRSAAGYRLYGKSELDRLLAIRGYREAGLPLAAIADLMAGREGDTAQILERRLVELNADIQRLREQQKRLATLLAQPALREDHRIKCKADWVALLRESGFSDHDMHQWHAMYEADSPQSHADFLRSLGLADDEVEGIRAWARTQP